MSGMQVYTSLMLQITEIKKLHTVHIQQTPVRTYRPSSEDSLKANGQSRRTTTSQVYGNGVHYADVL
jgi:hypothetical protein